MAPFTTFSYLRQAFTEGEVWTVCEDQLKLLQSASTSPPAGEVASGAKGARTGITLENLERNDSWG